MRKFKMVTILLYGKNKFPYIHSQTSSDGLNEEKNNLTEKIVILIICGDHIYRRLVHGAATPT